MTKIKADRLQQLRQAYHNTEYRLQRPPLTIRIGQYHHQLDSLLEESGHNCWCFITAVNPGSVQLDDATNRQRQRALLNEITQMGLTALPAHSQAIDQNWPKEPSFLVPGLNAAAGLALGKHYQQLALVHAQAGGRAKLLWCHK